MLTNGPNIYQAARKEGCLTQEQAAERLEVSETTVKAWEQGARVPDNETVARMAELYGTPWLLLEKAFETLSELGILPGGIHAQALPTAVLSYLDLCNQQLDGYRRLIQITADGRIDETEQADFNTIKSVILQNVVAGLQVALYQQPEPQRIKKERPVAATTRRSVQGLASENDSNMIISHRLDYASPNFGREGGVSR